MLKTILTLLAALPGLALAHTVRCPSALDNFLFPRPRKISARLMASPQIINARDFGTVAELALARAPLAVFKVRNREAFSSTRPPETTLMLIKTPGLGYAIPPGREGYWSTVQQIIDFEHAVNPEADQRFAYLSIEGVSADGSAPRSLPGFRLAGEMPNASDASPVEHVYLVADAPALTFTSQKFHLSGFDRDRFDLNSELDRQAVAIYESAAEPYQLFRVHPATPVRRSLDSSGRKAPTILKVFFSRAPLDTAGATPNPLLPQRVTSAAPGKALEKYIPPVHLSLSKPSHLGAIRGRRLGLVMVGDENARAAGFVAKMLENVGKKIEYIVTVRDPGHPGYPRQKLYPEFVLNGEYRIHPIAEDYAYFDACLRTSLHTFDEAAFGKPKVPAQSKTIEPVDALILVDVGGRSLARDDAQSKPLPEHGLMKAMRRMNKAATPSFVVTLGLGQSPDANNVGLAAIAGRYEPSAFDRAAVGAAAQKYQAARGPVTDQALNLWLQAMRGEYGRQTFPPLYPHDPLVDVKPEHATLLLLPVDPALARIQAPLRLIEIK